MMSQLSNLNKRICISILLCLTWIFDSGQAQPAARIDPRVLEDTLGGKEAHFLVVFDKQVITVQNAAPGVRSNSQVADMVESLKNAAVSNQATARAYLDQIGREYRSYWIANILAVKGDREVVEYLARLPEVSLIEPDREFKVELEVADKESILIEGTLSITTIELNLSQVHAPEVWAFGATGSGTVYAVADTGVFWQHAALISQYRGWNGSTASHDYNWWDAIHADIDGKTNICEVGGSEFDLPYPCDDHGHGTHVVGIGVGDDGYGNQIGMAPDARWIACRNMDSGVGRPSTYIECLQFFMAPTDLNGNNPNPSLRPDVISNSYGCPPSELCDAHSLQLAVEAVRAAGIFMAVSAGNRGPGCESITDPPALEASVFTIGAVDISNTIANYSSRGPVTIDTAPLMKPNLVAPGTNIRSSTFDADYGFKTGTSMAAPHVAGAVALLWGAFPSLKRDVAATESLLAATALPFTTDEGCGGDGPTQVPNNTYGSGLLDVQKAYWTAYWSIQPKYIFPIVFKN